MRQRRINESDSEDDDKSEQSQQQKEALRDKDRNDMEFMLDLTNELEELKDKESLINKLDFIIDYEGKIDVLLPKQMDGDSKHQKCGTKTQFDVSTNWIRPKGILCARSRKIDRASHDTNSQQVASGDGVNFIQQYYITKGLKKFGEKDGKEAAMKELQQMVDRNCWEPKMVSELTPEEKKKAVEAMMLLAENQRTIRLQRKPHLSLDDTR